VAFSDVLGDKPLPEIKVTHKRKIASNRKTGNNGSQYSNGRERKTKGSKSPNDYPSLGQSGSSSNDDRISNSIAKDYAQIMKSIDERIEAKNEVKDYLFKNIVNQVHSPAFSTRDAAVNDFLDRNIFVDNASKRVFVNLTDPAENGGKGGKIVEFLKEKQYESIKDKVEEKVEETLIKRITKNGTIKWLTITIQVGGSIINKLGGTVLYVFDPLPCGPSQVDLDNQTRKALSNFVNK
jgi:hypothetical protein